MGMLGIIMGCAGSTDFRATPRDPVAQFEIGLNCLERNDAKQAFEWFQRAASQGNTKAQVMLGAVYWRGDGMPKDSKMAAYWFQKAAVQGNREAQNILGNMYVSGEGVPQDKQQAIIWLQKAAVQGELEAQKLLGLLQPKAAVNDTAHQGRVIRDIVEITNESAKEVEKLLNESNNAAHEESSIYLSPNLGMPATSERCELKREWKWMWVNGQRIRYVERHRVCKETP